MFNNAFSKKINFQQYLYRISQGKKLMLKPILKGRLFMSKTNPISLVRDVMELTQETLSKKLDITRQTVINYENNPDTIPYAILRKLEDLSGIPIEELTREDRKMPSPQLKKPLFEAKFKELKKKILPIETITLLNSLSSDKNDFEREEIKTRLVDITKISKNRGKKPIIAAFGIPNSGKSTLFNHIVGEEIAPSGYQPLTSALTYYHHISEKNENMNDVDDTEVILKDKSTITGHHDGLLKAFGTRNGAYYDKKDFEPERIDVYLDCDILKEFTYLDVPGFGSERTEDDCGLMADMREIDYIFFLSQATSFLVNGSEMIALKQLIASREDLNSICILATHANAVGTPQKAEEIVSQAHDRLIRSMTEMGLKNLGINDDPNKLRARFKILDCRNLKYCKDFNNDFVNTITNLVNTKFDTLYKDLSKACSEFIEDYSHKKNVLEEESISEMDSEEEQHKFKIELDKKIAVISDDMNNYCDKCNDSSLTTWRNEYYTVIDENYIIDALERKGIKNNKRDIELFSSYLSDELSERLNKTLKNKSEDFSDKLDEHLKDMSEWSQQYCCSDNMNINVNGFDFQRAFATGLAGMSVFGALAFWAAITAGGSNLGAYILCAKVVSALSSLGISLGGTAAVNAAIAAIGGPVTIGIAISVIAAITVWGILTGTWKKRLAKKLVEQYRNHGYYDEYCNYINNYWDSTKNALNECLKIMKSKFQAHFDNQLEKCRLTDAELEKTKADLSYIYTSLIDVFSDVKKSCEDYFKPTKE